MLPSQIRPGGMVLARDLSFGRFVYNRVCACYYLNEGESLQFCPTQDDWQYEYAPKFVLVASRLSDGVKALSEVIGELARRWEAWSVPMHVLIRKDDPLLASQLMMLRATDVIPVEFVSEDPTFSLISPDALSTSVTQTTDSEVASVKIDDSDRLVLSSSSNSDVPYYNFVLQSFGESFPTRWELFHDLSDQQIHLWIRVIKLIIELFNHAAAVFEAPIQLLFNKPNYLPSLIGTGTAVLHLRSRFTELEARTNAEWLRQYLNVIQTLTELASTHQKPGLIPVIPLQPDYRAGMEWNPEPIIENFRLWDWLSVPFASSTALCVRLFRLFASRWGRPNGPLPTRL